VRSAHSERARSCSTSRWRRWARRRGEIILDLIRDRKEQGHAMIVVAHNYIHVLEICDRVNLVQHGRITFDEQTSETSAEELTDLVAAEYRATKKTRSG
jgi:simple sugar transport system ATP-binding protein